MMEGKGGFFFADDPWAVRMVADGLCPSYGQRHSWKRSLTCRNSGMNGNLILWVPCIFYFMARSIVGFPALSRLVGCLCKKKNTPYPWFPSIIKIQNYIHKKNVSLSVHIVYKYCIFILYIFIYNLIYNEMGPRCRPLDAITLGEVPQKP